MYLVDFMNSHENWLDILSAAPYSIKVEQTDCYYLLKYHAFVSDFSKPEVQEARGSIFAYDGKWKCVCHPMDKFFNYGEEYAHPVDWTSAVVYEKVDGSLMKVWYHNGWHLSSNGCIRASDAEVSGQPDFDYEQLFYKALPCSFSDFANKLDKDYTYCFELVSPFSKLVVEYHNTALYYLGRRNIITHKEDYEERDLMTGIGIRLPKVYPIHSLESAVMVAKEMTSNEEGFVVRDKDFNRIKIKGEAYLKAFHLRGNNIFSEKRVIEAMRGGYLDDMKAYCADWSNRIDEVVKNYIDCSLRFDEVYSTLMKEKYSSQKDYALAVNKLDRVYRNYLFEAKRNYLSGSDYLNKLPPEKMLAVIKEVF